MHMFVGLTESYLLAHIKVPGFAASTLMSLIRTKCTSTYTHV